MSVAIAKRDISKTRATCQLRLQERFFGRLRSSAANLRLLRVMGLIECRRAKFVN